MRAITRLAAITAVAGLLSGGVATAASAATANLTQAGRPAGAVHLTGGTTTVTTGPGIAGALLKNAILPVATSPGRESVTFRKSGPAVRLAFPVTGGQVSLSPLGGRIDHQGGILFINLCNGKRVEVSAFIIDLSHGDLTGIVNGNPKARVPLFTLNLSHAKLSAGQHTATATGIGLDLTATAASALDSTLGTHLFSAGLALGTGGTVLHF